MKALELLDPIDFVLNEEGDCDVRATLKKQAVISFKEGINEVVEWIQANYLIPNPMSRADKELWQTKLNEWGIGTQTVEEAIEGEVIKESE